MSANPADSIPAVARAACWGPDNTLLVKELPVPRPGPGQLLVRVRACGICGTDIHRLHQQPSPPPSDFAACHELAGEVVAVGPGADGSLIGSHVATPGLVTCGVCELCQSGRHVFCRGSRMLGVATPGGMAEYFLAEERFAFPVADDVPWTVAALTEPCAVSVHGLLRAGFEPRQRVLVLGAGPIGLLAALAARDGGATTVGITARYPHQREAALAMGATAVFDPDEVGAAATVSERAWDLVVETVGGQAPTLQQAVEVVAPRGTVIFIGNYLEPQLVDTRLLQRTEAAVIGALGYDMGPNADFALATALLSRHAGKLGALVTNEFPLARVGDAFAAAESKRAGAIKVTVTP